jgi:UDP-glucose 4-epimerase
VNRLAQNSTIGNGNGFSVKEVIQQVKDITGKDFKVLEEGRRDGDPSTLIASDNKAKKELNLSPGYVSLESIIKTLS